MSNLSRKEQLNRLKKIQRQRDGLDTEALRDEKTQIVEALGPLEQGKATSEDKKRYSQLKKDVDSYQQNRAIVTDMVEGTPQSAEALSKFLTKPTDISGTLKDDVGELDFVDIDRSLMPFEDVQRILREMETPKTYMLRLEQAMGRIRRGQTLTNAQQNAIQKILEKISEIDEKVSKENISPDERREFNNILKGVVQWLGNLLDYKGLDGEMKKLGVDSKSIDKKTKDKILTLMSDSYNSGSNLSDMAKSLDIEFSSRSNAGTLSDDEDDDDFEAPKPRSSTKDDDEIPKVSPFSPAESKVRSRKRVKDDSPFIIDDDNTTQTESQQEDINDLLGLMDGSTFSPTPKSTKKLKTLLKQAKPPPLPISSLVPKKSVLKGPPKTRAQKKSFIDEISDRNRESYPTKLKPASQRKLKPKPKSAEQSLFDELSSSIEKRRKQIEGKNKKNIGEGVKKALRRKIKISDTKIDMKTGQFGKLYIDPQHLKRMQLKMYTKYKGKLLAKGPISSGLKKLLTSQNLKDVTEQDLLDYQKLMTRASIPFSDLNQGGNLAKKLFSLNKTKPKPKAKGKEYVFYKDIDELKGRLEVLVGSMEAGNDSNDLKQEISQLLTILKTNDAISEMEYVNLNEILGL